MKRITVVFLLSALCLCYCAAAMATGVSTSDAMLLATNRNKAIALCVNDLTEHEDWSSSEAYLSLASCQHGYYEGYLQGTEPVWVISFTDRLTGSTIQFVLGSNVEWIAKIGENEELLSKDDVYYVSETEAPNNLPSINDYFNSAGEYFYNWSIAEKAAFSNEWMTYVNDLVLSRQLEREWVVGEKYYQWTRRMYGVPSASNLSEDEAFAKALDALQKLDKNVIHKKNYVSFFDVTDCDSPQWRFYIDYQYAVIIDAKTGEILFLRDGDMRDYDVDEFMMQE